MGHGRRSGRISESAARDQIPDGMVDEDEISDYISDQTGWCHYRLDVLEGCEDNPVYRKEIQEIRKELSEIQEYIKTELF